MAIKKLPTFKGFVVDFKLKQFRKIEFHAPPYFVNFRSKKGRKLLNQLRKEGFTTPPMILSKEGKWIEIKL